MKKNIKKFMLLVFCILFSFTLCACSSHKKEYTAITKAQENIINLSSGKFIITSSYDKPEKANTIKTEFIFNKNSDGTLSYCQTQYDKNDKPVCCKFSDGKTTEQWLIGKGWETVEAPAFTADNPHQYISVLTEIIPNKYISSIAVNNEQENTVYTVDINSKNINKHKYNDSDLSISSETVKFILSSEGELNEYEDVASVKDTKSESDCIYTLNIKLVEKDNNPTITKPDLKSPVFSNKKTNEKKSS